MERIVIIPKKFRLSDLPIPGKSEIHLLVKQCHGIKTEKISFSKMTIGMDTHAVLQSGYVVEHLSGYSKKTLG